MRKMFVTFCKNIHQDKKLLFDTCFNKVSLRPGCQTYGAWAKAGPQWGSIRSINFESEKLNKHFK